MSAMPTASVDVSVVRSRNADTTIRLTLKVDADFFGGKLEVCLPIATAVALNDALRTAVAGALR